MFEIQDFVSLLVVGSAISLIIQLIKNKFGTDSTTTKLLTITLAVCIGSGYVLLQNTPWFPTVVQILSVSSMVYALILKKKNPDAQSH